MIEKITGFIKKQKILSYVILGVIVLIMTAGGFVIVGGRRADPLPREEIEDNFEDDEPVIVETKPQPEEESDDTEELLFNFPDETLRPYGVLIDNEGTKCLPQGGIHRAQFVYEALVEGGETRLMPIFWFGEGDEKMLVGPIRSARHYFIDFSMEHGCIFVHYGWSPLAISDIRKYKINNINGVANGGWIFWDITDDPYNWQDSYTDPGNMMEYTGQAGYTTDKSLPGVFAYNGTPKEYEDYEDALEISIQYSYFNKVNYVYNAEEAVYYRFRQDLPHMERNSEEQFTAKNIIIRPTKNYTIAGDKEGRQEILTVGEGRGYYITMGKIIPITWEKTSREEATLYRDEAGDHILLNPGQTWIQVVPLGDSVVSIQN